MKTSTASERFLDVVIVFGYVVIALRLAIIAIRLFSQ